ncbi:MAG: DNA mismatch repair endonuclease MutL [Elusimicrobiota bacterium]
MSKIKILPLDVINKISAGEVVERPAAVVKELIENSLDAGASQIAVEIKDGGRELIRVVDDGLGMNTEDAQLCWQRHATSKIASETDLFNIHTFGFRGEALPSIAEVSNFNLQTCAEGLSSGWELDIKGGKINFSRQTGCPAGTRVTVKNLFFNTPARLKFLKSNFTETQHITQLFMELVIANPQMGFRLVIDNKEWADYLPEKNLARRLERIYGRETLNQLLPLSSASSIIKLEGLISNFDYTRAKKTEQYFFVNRRSIRSRILIHALYEAYKEFLPSQRHPVAFLFLEIDSQLVDVNVHPTKREVRFQEEGAIHQLVANALRQCLSSSAKFPAISLEKNEAPTEPGKRNNVEEALAGYFSSPQPSGGQGREFNRSFSPSIAQPERMAEKDLFAPAVAEKTDWAGIRSIGQVKNLFILAQTEGELLIIDQHAASERILYERFKKAEQKKSLAQQGLLLPWTVEVNPKQKAVIENNLALLHELGFQVEHFGGFTYTVKSLPALIGGADRRIFQDIVDSLEENIPPEERREKIMITACRSAVKAHDKLSPEEINQLLLDLRNCANPYTCPHGRPITIRLTWEEIKKKLGR